MQLKKPLVGGEEHRYLTHCANIANILANNQSAYAQERVKKYIEIAGAELEEQKPVKSLVDEYSVTKKLCPRCHAEVEFAQDPLRICDHCGWRGDYTKLEES